MNYKLPGRLTDFQREMYIHLIEWKWKHITRETGVVEKKDKNGYIRRTEYDAILPLSVRDAYPLIYPDVLEDFLAHCDRFYVRLHDYFHHMASSQAANINLFLPVLLHSRAAEVLRQVKPDFARLATNELYKGFRIEFWDGNSFKDKGLLGDHNRKSGTDSDIGIAYFNQEDDLCLWLVEHKLTESEFTTCGGYRSEENTNKERCFNSFNTILADKDLCHYHRINRYEYWNLTDTNKDLFINALTETQCPFMDGVNQLWRNQLLGLGLEQQCKFKHVFFSVVKHPDNNAINEVLSKYQWLISNDIRFNWFPSCEMIYAAEAMNNEALDAWAAWYRDLYMSE